MAIFYIQLQDKLLQISGDLTTENISKALGYVPVSPNVTNELSQRVDNITFDSLKDNPFLQDGSGDLNIVDESGNIIAKIDAEGIHSVDFIAGEHRLSDKTDKTYVDEAVKNVKVDLTGYATEEYVNNIDFYNINNNPIVDGEENSLTLVDENGNIGLKVTKDGLHVKDVIADGHTLSQKADKSELSNYATKDEVSDLVDMSVVTELQGKVNTLIDTDADKSVRDIAVDVLTETLVSETATEAYDTLAEMSAWIKSHPEDASAMNTAIQKNATDITNLDAAYKAADAKVLTDAQEYTDNINFYTIKDNPIVDGEAGSLTFVDETGYIGLKVTEDGIIAKDFVTSEHILSQKADKSELPTKVSELENDSNFITIEDVPEVTVPTKVSELENDKGYITASDIPEINIPSLDEYVKSEDLPNFDEFAKTEDIPSLNGYATEEYVNQKEQTIQIWVNNKEFATQEDVANIDFYSIKDNPIVDNNDGNLTFVDESGNIGLQFSNNAILVNDVITPEHTLSSKADKSFVEDNYYNKSTIDKKIVEAVTGGQISLDGYATEQWVNEQGFLKNHQDISHLVTKEEIGEINKTINVNEKVTASALNVLNDKINILDEVVNENEKVSSLIANDLNKKLINNETLIGDINNEIINLSNQNDAIKNSINEIDVNVKTNQNTIDELIDIVIENEDVTANAIAKLNKRINSNNELIENVSSNTLEEFERINLKNNENDETIKSLVEASNNRDEYLETLGDELNENERMAALAFNDLNKRNIATNELINSLKNVVERNEKVTANALNVLNDNKQDKLVSGINIKTINGQSILGEGNIIVEGGNGEGIDLSKYYTKNDIDSKGYITSVPSEYITENELNQKNYVSKNSLSNVATSGSYNDLTNKPTIPTQITENTVSGWGFTKNTGTVTNVKINGSTKSPSNGVVDLGTVITSHQDISGKQDKLVSGTNIKTINGQSILGEGNIIIEGGNGENKDEMSTPSFDSLLNNPIVEDESGVLNIADENGNLGFKLSNEGIYAKNFIAGDHTLSNKQDKLVSGTNIKTINGISILGSGDIVISSGGDSSSESGAYSEVNHGTSDTTFTLTPNTFHIWDEVSSLTLTIGSGTSGIANEYLFQFTSGSEPTTLILPESIKFNSDFTIEENKIYQISILNGLGTVMNWDI